MACNLFSVFSRKNNIEIPFAYPKCPIEEIEPIDGIREIIAQPSTPAYIPVLKSSAPRVDQAAMFQQLFDTMVVLDNTPAISNVPGKVNAVVNQMFAYRDRYQNVSGKYSTPIRWYHIALIYKMESDEPRIDVPPTFKFYLGNGQLLSKKTTIVPVGRGAFKSWEEGCWDAIELQGLHKKMDWSEGETLRLLESFNGTGYRDYHSMQSPYVFSGSNHYISGKYVSDGRFQSTVVSSQIGVALYLKEILRRL